MSRWGPVAAVACVLAACGASARQTAGSLQQAAGTVYHSTSSGYTQPQRLVVRDAAAAGAMWATLFAPGAPPPMPDVDFTNRMLLVAALGPRPSGGYDVAFGTVALDGSVLRAEVIEQAPGSGCVTAAVITSPVTVLSVPRHDGEVAFTDSRTMLECGRR